MRTLILCGLLLGAVAACSVDSPPPRTLSERQRDSLIGESALPGAVVVKRAIATSDQQGTRAAALDSLGH